MGQHLRPLSKKLSASRYNTSENMSLYLLISFHEISKSATGLGAQHDQGPGAQPSHNQGPQWLVWKNHVRGTQLCLRCCVTREVTSPLRNEFPQGRAGVGAVVSDDIKRSLLAMMFRHSPFQEGSTVVGERWKMKERQGRSG